MSLEDKQFEHYKLLSLIGRGGMSEVYLAQDTRISRQLAVKVLQMKPPTTAYLQQQNNDDMRLFKRELQTVANLHHPHILQLYDFGDITIDSLHTVYMVMPYLYEGSLDDYLRQHSTAGPLSSEEVSHFITQAADALQYAHNNNVVHRDVKPSNFLVHSQSGTAKHPDILLTDFGVAKLSTPNATFSQAVRGTPAYMAPEQWDESKPPVPATDQYALAVMAYVMLTGRPPFMGSVEQVMKQHLREHPKAPSTYNPQVSPALDAVILRALKKNPHARFASVTDFAQAFSQVVQQSSGKKSFSQTGMKPSWQQTINIPQHHSSRIGFKALFLIGLILLILGSSAGFFTYKGYAHIHNLDATATVQTQKSIAKATAVAHLTATASAIAAIAAPPSYMPEGIREQAKFLFSDALQEEQNDSHWHDETAPDYSGTCQYYGASYTITSETQQRGMYDCPSDPLVPTPTNFAIEIQMRILTGNCGGILFRGDYAKNTYYYFKVCNNHTFNVRKVTSATTSIIIYQPAEISLNFNDGSPITLAVLAIGSTISLYGNDLSLGQFQDSSFPQGQFALFAQYGNSSTQVTFSNARVWTLQ